MIIVKALDQITMAIYVLTAAMVPIIVLLSFIAWGIRKRVKI